MDYFVITLAVIIGVRAWQHCKRARLIQSMADSCPRKPASRWGITTRKDD